MSTEEITTIVVTYPVTLAQIDDQLAALAFVEKPAEVVKAIRSCVDLRTQIEARRKLLKADSLAYGRAVDKAAAELTDRVRKHETPLLERKAQHEAEKAAAKAAKEQAERAAQEEAYRAKRAAEEAELAAKRQAEEQALVARRAEIAKAKEEAAAEAAQERAKLQAERAAMVAELAASRAEMAAAEEHRKAAQVLLDRIEQAKREEQTRARLAAEAEEQREAKEKHDAEVAAKVAAAQPDIVRIRAWSDRIAALAGVAPACMDRDAGLLVERAREVLTEVVSTLRAFDGAPHD